MKKTFKSLIAVAMVSLLAFSVVACGNNQPATPETPAETPAVTLPAEVDPEETPAAVDFTGQSITIGVWGGNDAEEAALNQVIADFEAKTGATIEKKIYTEYNTQIQADFIGGTAPDAFYVDASIFPFFADLGVLAPLDPVAFDTAAFEPALMSAFTTADGTIYSIPKDASTLALYYNIDLLEEAGFTIDDVPTSYEELKTWIPELQAALDEIHGAGMVTAMTNVPELARTMHILQRGGVSVANDDGTANLEDPTIVTNQQFLIDLWSEGFATPQSLGAGWNGEAFGLGKTVLMEEGNWVFQNLIDNFPDVNFGVRSMMSYEGEVSSMAFTVGWSVNANAANAELAKAWIQFVTGLEGMATWTAGAGVLPSRQDVSQKINLGDNPRLQVHVDMISVATPWQKGVTLTTIADNYMNFLPSAVDGSMTVQEAMAAADAQANNEIAMAN